MKDITRQITELSGIDFPPKTQENWLRLLMLAGFSQSLVDSVFREFGYDGYDHAVELPRVYVSVAGESENGHNVSIDDSLLFTQRIIAGLEALRGRDHVRKTDVSAETVEMRALAYLIANSERKLTKVKIAKAINCHPKTLTPKKAPRFHAAFNASRNYENPPSGVKSADGDLESFSGRLRGWKADDNDG